MKTTIDSLQQKADNAKERKARLQTHVSELEAEAARLEAEARTAAVNGEVENYRDLKDRIERTQDEKKVALVQLEAGIPQVTQNEAAEAWAAYRSTSTPKMKKQLQDLDKARDAFLTAYRKTVDLQREACAARERLAAFTGRNRDDPNIPALFPLDEAIRCRTAADGAVGLLHTGGTSATDPDLVFFLASLNLDALTMQQDARANEIQAVVRQQKTGGFAV